MRTVSYKDIKACLSPYHDESYAEKGMAGWLFDPDKVPSLNKGYDPCDNDYLDPVIFCTKKQNYDNAARRVASFSDIKIVY